MCYSQKSAWRWWLGLSCSSETPFFGLLLFLGRGSWVSEIMADVIAIGVVTVGVSTDRKLKVLDLLLMVLGSTGEELMKGCPFPAERLMAP